jgi:hypothetical protein
MAIVNITTQNDCDFIRSFAYQNIDTTPIDLTGYTMRMGIRKRAIDATEEMLLTTENGGIVITDAPNGKFSIVITQNQLVTQLEITDYEHSLIRMASGMHLRIWSGTLTNTAGASR